MSNTTSSNARWPPTPAGARWPCAFPSASSSPRTARRSCSARSAATAWKAPANGWLPSAWRPGYLMALLAGAAEFFGGLALIARLARAPGRGRARIHHAGRDLHVHIDKGLFMAKNGYEYALALLAVSVSLAIGGAGKASIDRKLSVP